MALLGGWVAEALGVRTWTRKTPVGVGVETLTGIALRRNPRRTQLIVSRVLGKHVPTDPDLVVGSGRLLGLLVAQALGWSPPADGLETAGRLVGDACAGAPGAARGLVDHVDGLGPGPAPGSRGAVVLGYAETATALGHLVADALDAPYLHSTRRPVAGVTPVGGFTEEHSHARDHLLLPADPRLLAGDGPVVLVDDELSTGTTVLNTIAELQLAHPRERYVLATLVDLRSEADHGRTTAFAALHRTRIDVVALVQAGIDLPDDVLPRGQALVERLEAAREPDHPASVASPVRVVADWPADLPVGGRHGFLPADRPRLDAAVDTLADVVARACGEARRVHVLGTEELMYAPLRLASALAQRLDGALVRSSATTSSPILALDDPGYPVRTRLTFPAHDRPVGGPAARYAYNVAAPASDPGGRAGVVVLVVDAAGDGPELVAPDGLVAQLGAAAGRVVLVVLPDGAPRGRTAADPTPRAEGA